MPNIKLKGQTGEVLTYEDVERVYFDSADEDGEVVYYTHGKIMEGVTIEPNFAKGDQVISVPDGSLVKEATIVKPAALVPENIRAGTNVAGVVGELIGDTEEVTVDLDMKNGGQVITPTAEGKVMSKVVVTKPGDAEQVIAKGKTLGGIPGEYVTPGTTKEIEPDFSGGDHTVTAEGDERWDEVVVKKPENLSPDVIAKDEVVFGIVGQYGGGSDFDYSDENLKPFAYKVDLDNKVVEVQLLSYDELYARTGGYDVTIPDTLGGYPVTVNANFFNRGYGNGFFMNNNVKNISIGQNVRFVNNSMERLLANCKNMTSKVCVPNGVTNLSQVLYSCSNFNQPISIPNSVTDLYYALYGCSKFNQPISIPDSATNIQGLFYSCSNFNQPVEIPQGITSSASLFQGCSNFNQPINIPNSVTSIGSFLYMAANFNQPVNIPNGVTSVTYALGGCSNMSKNITIHAANINNFYRFLYNKNNSKRVNVFVPAGSETETAMRVANTQSVVGAAITWTNNASNNCFYNTTRNIYVYNTL